MESLGDDDRARDANRVHGAFTALVGAIAMSIDDDVGRARAFVNREPFDGNLARRPS